MAEAVRYFHGGYGGLKVSDLVLPPSVTGAVSTASYGAASVCRRDRVYITSQFDNAVDAAAVHPSGRGRVYEVKPLGEITPDPDALLMPGQEPWSWECPKAVVVAVHRIPGKTKKRIKKKLGREFGVVL
jgi:rifampin ADP-ribosylating transferase